jgi:hypothetical protein
MAINSPSLADLLVGHRIEVKGKHRLLMSSLPYYFFLFIYLTYYQFIWEHAWLATLLIYNLVPLCDEVFKLDDSNPNETERKQLNADNPFFELCLYIPMVVDWLLFFREMDYFATF